MDKADCSGALMFRYEDELNLDLEAMRSDTWITDNFPEVATEVFVALLALAIREFMAKQELTLLCFRIDAFGKDEVVVKVLKQSGYYFGDATDRV